MVNVQAALDQHLRKRKLTFERNSSMVANAHSSSPECGGAEVSKNTDPNDDGIIYCQARYP